MLQRIADVLTKAHEGSIHSLVTLLQDNATTPNVRRSAARDILDLAPRLREEASLEKRLAAGCCESHRLGVIAWPITPCQRKSLRW